MKKYLLAIVAFLFIQCTKKSETIITNMLKSDLIYLKEVEWPKAYREQDTALLDRILAESFQMIDANGNYFGKESEMEWIRNNKTSYDSFNYEIKALNIFKNGTAIVSGTGHIYNDTTHTVYQSSNVLLLKEGQWKALASHVSGVKNID